MVRRLVPALALLALWAGPVCADDIDYRVIDPDSYQSFVGNWALPDRPFCAALQSTSQWNEVMHPAPTMGPDRPFGPPASFWATHSVVLMARVMPAGNPRGVFSVNAVRTGKRGLEITYSYAPPPRSRSKMKWYLAVVVPAPLPDNVRLIENRHEICKVTPGAWSPFMTPGG